jgi:lipoteichoic acid synthase
MNNLTLYRICSITISLMLIYISVRSRIIYKGYAFFYPERLPDILFASYYDFAYAVGFGLLVLLIAFLLRRRPKALQALSLGYAVFALLHIMIALVNVYNVKHLGVPFNYQWLYYSDFLNNNDSKTAIFANLTPQFFMQFIKLSAVFGVVALLINYGLKRFYQSFSYKKQLLYSMGVLALFYFVAGRGQLVKSNFEYGKTANPVVAFVSSCIMSMGNSSNLFTMTLPDDFEQFPNQHKDNDSIRSGYIQSKEHPEVQNLILFVLESVPAEYVAGYNHKYKVTPNIERYLNQSMVFSDIYAHIPSTHNALVSLLGSLYPQISYESVTQEHPTIAWPTISSELKAKGYNTAFFQSSDNKFARMDEFLSKRRFDKIADYKDIPCNTGIFDSKWEYLDGVDEKCLAEAALNWLPQHKTSKPFFATLWTMQTHYPYFSSGPEKDFGVDYADLNRYLNALQNSDAILGNLLDELNRRGLSESTLVVVVGDHGEAFGKHDVYGHATGLYEENLRVPLLFINPLLFKGQKKSIVGGQVDIAPTIMDVLGLPAPPDWQGMSLLHPDHINRAYFLNPYSSYLFGYRTQDFKVIFNASDNVTQVFDLKRDPEERTNLAEQMPDFVDLSYKRIARWVQYHKQVMEEAVAKSSSAPSFATSGRVVTDTTVVRR